MYKKMFQYFLNKYIELNKKKYVYFKNRSGIELMKIKRLKLTEVEFIAFIDYLYEKKKLISINFLAIQVNDFHASGEYRSNEEIKMEILHQDIMKIRYDIINNCTLCNKTGYINKTEQCSCMKKFMKIRDRMRKGSV